MSVLKNNISQFEIFRERSVPGILISTHKKINTHIFYTVQSYFLIKRGVMEMYRKFACLNYVNSINEIPVRLNLPKGEPAKQLDWYVEKFNPFVMEDFMVAEEMGYKIKMPITEDEAENDMEKTDSLVTKTIRALKEYHVEIILPPKNICGLIRGQINVADGVLLYPFFLVKAIKKALKTLRKDIKYCEVVVANGLCGNCLLAESVLDNIYEDVNFLTIADSGGDFERWYKKADRFFDDIGLNLIVSKINKTLFRTADVIINIGNSLGNYDFAYKRNAVFFDLTGDANRRAELIRRRDDMIVIDGLQLKYKNCSMPIQQFELAFYLKSREYRLIAAKQYTTQNGDAVRRMIEKMGVAVGTIGGM